MGKAAPACRQEDLTVTESSNDVTVTANITTATSEWFDYLGSLLGIQCAGVIDLVGFLGNFLCIVCMCRQKRPTSMLVIVLGLAVADSLLLFLHLLFQVALNLYADNFGDEAFANSFAWIKMAVWPLSMAVHTIGVLLTVLICVSSAYI